MSQADPNKQTRREWLKLAAAGAAAAGLPRRAPAMGTPRGARPQLSQGVQSGDVTVDGAVIWSRTDRPSQMHVRWATNAKLNGARGRTGPAALVQNDFTGKLALRGLPVDREIFYEVRFESLAQPGVFSAPTYGRFVTPPVQPGGQPIKFAWSGDTCGQGYGINPDLGGLFIYETMRRQRPDFFIHCGDLIYADHPIRPTKRRGGKTWRNLVTPEKSKVAETLAEFRGNYRYNLLDHNVRRFGAEVPQIIQWDDHETKNNWYPGRVLTEDDRYTVKSCDLLAARSRRAFFEYTPVATNRSHEERIFRHLRYGPLLDVFVLDARSYRGPNSRNQQTLESKATAFFGSRQLAWLRDRLRRSTATWKVIACDQPLCLMVGHDAYRFEGIANGTGPAKGRELEVASLLSFIKQARISNVVFLTADVHYAAAHHYAPERAHFKDFNPFWEFVAGPLNAATFGPNRLDRTFGAKEIFISERRGQKPGRSPFVGGQYFGTCTINPRTFAMTTKLFDLRGKELFSVDLPAERRR